MEINHYTRNNAIVFERVPSAVLLSSQFRNVIRQFLGFSNCKKPNTMLYPESIPRLMTTNASQLFMKRCSQSHIVRFFFVDEDRTRKSILVMYEIAIANG